MSTNAHYLPLPTPKLVARYRQQMTRKAFTAWMTRRETLAKLDPLTLEIHEAPPRTRKERRAFDREFARVLDKQAIRESGWTLMEFRASQGRHITGSWRADPWRSNGCKAHPRMETT